MSIKCVFLYPMPDSSLRVILYSFLLLSFRICLPLKNDGRGELRFREVVNDFSPKKKSTGNVSRPRLSGKVAAKPSEGASVSRNVRTKK